MIQTSRQIILISCTSGQRLWAYRLKCCWPGSCWLQARVISTLRRCRTFALYLVSRARRVLPFSWDCGSALFFILFQIGGISDSMQYAAYILEGLFETSLIITGFFYLFFWIAGHKPTNLEALYIFAAVLAFALVINFVDSSNWLLLVLFLSWMPSLRKKPKPTFPSK